jgi:hypothetical protein
MYWGGSRRNSDLQSDAESKPYDRVAVRREIGIVQVEEDEQVEESSPAERLCVSASDKQAVDFDDLFPRPVPVSPGINNDAVGRLSGRGIWHGIGEVFIFEVSKDITQGIVEDAGKIVACEDPSAVNIGFKIGILKGSRVVIIILILHILVVESHSEMELIYHSESDFRGYNDACDGTEFEADIATDCHPVPEFVFLRVGCFLRIQMAGKECECREQDQQAVQKVLHNREEMGNNSVQIYEISAESSFSRRDSTQNF